MTEENTNQPPAGWYPNPQDTTQARWWDGQSWTDHLNAAPTATVMLPPPAPNVSGLGAAASGRDLRAGIEIADAPVGGRAAGPDSSLSPLADTAGGPKFWERTEAYRVGNAVADKKAGTNSPAQIGLVFGIISILFNPLLLVGITSFILSLRGLSRARKWEREGFTPVGRKKAVWGLVLSSVGSIVAIIIIGTLLSSGFRDGFASTQPQFDKPGVEQLITAGMLKQGVSVDTVQCPDTPTMTEGNQFQCVATQTDGTTRFVNIRVQDSKGNITWQLK